MRTVRRKRLKLLWPSETSFTCWSTFYMRAVSGEKCNVYYGLSRQSSEGCFIFEMVALNVENYPKL